MPSAAQCRGPSAGSRWRCRAGPWECRRRGFSSGATEIGHRVGNGGRRWRRRSPNCPPTIAGRTGRRGPARHELAGIEEHRRDVDGRDGCGGSPKTPAAGTATPDKSAPRRPTGCAAISPRTQRPDVLCAGVHRNPHRRRQTPLATVLDLYSRRSYRYPTLDRALCPAHASVDPSAGHPPSVSESSGQRGGADRRRRSGLAPTTVLADGCEAGGCQCVVGRVKEHQTELAHLNFVAVG